MNPTSGDFYLIINDVTFDLGSSTLGPISVVIDVLILNFLVEGTESFTLSANITDPGIQGGGVFLRQNM